MEVVNTTSIVKADPLFEETTELEEAYGGDYTSERANDHGTARTYD